MSSTKIALVFLVLLGLYLLSLFTAGYTSPISSNRQDLRVRSRGAGLDVFYFYGSGCPHCARVEPFLAEMEQKYSLVIHRYDIYSNRSLFSVFEEISQRYGLPEGNRGVPTVFVGNTYFMGDDPILKNLEQTVKIGLEKGNAASQIASSNATGMLDTALGADETGNSNSAGLDSLPFLTITVAALVDSINPCAIAILLFLLAGLLMFRKREKALRVGLAFTLSVFIANILFGFGIIAAINVTSFSSVFQAASGSIALLTGVLLVKDSFFPGGGGFIMEVPRSLRPYLKRKLSIAFFGKNASVLAVFLVGFLVTSFEVPCTGGPYFYVLARVADGATRVEAVPTLLYYNVVFVLPLALITALLYFGSVHVEKASEWKGRNKPLIDLARGLPMIGVGLLTLPQEGMIQVAAFAFSIFRATFIPLVMILISYIVCQILSNKEYRQKTFRLTVAIASSAVIVGAAFSIGPFSLTSISLAQAANHVFVTVLHNDNCPREGAIVKIYDRQATPQLMGLCNNPIYTNASGQCYATAMTLSPGTVYKAIAYYPPPNTHWYEMLFLTDGNGNGQVTIHKGTNYPNGTESCGDSECDGFRYCFSGTPNYIECRHNDTDTPPIWNQDCDTKKCCSCSAGTLTNPAANYNETHNSDCPSCEVCSALDTCSYVLNGTDPKKDCPGNDFCSGLGNCTAISPAITVLSPQNQTYYSNSTPLTFVIDEPTSWIGYSLDSQANVTTSGNTTLTGLSDGSHAVIVYANETDGNMGSSGATYFAVDTGPPAITILSPQNQTYANTTIPLTYSIYDFSPISWTGYSLDGQANATITGNTTLSDLSINSHSIVVYSNDSFGNMGSSQTTYFSVDTVSPTVMVLSPQNVTYSSSSIPLTFTVSEPAPWMGYSLDGQANVTISGNTTLAGLSNGSHSIVVYAVDAAGNMGSSAIISFVVDAASSNGGGGRMPYMD